MPASRDTGTGQRTDQGWPQDPQGPSVSPSACLRAVQCVLQTGLPLWGALTLHSDLRVPGAVQSFCSVRKIWSFPMDPTPTLQMGCRGGEAGT